MSNSLIRRMIAHEMAGAVILLAAAVAAFALVNCPVRYHGVRLAEYYDSLWKLRLGLAAAGSVFEMPLHRWVNDGLMAIFFLYVGLAIKREMLAGELASFKKALLPILAAIGGMVFPAIFYALLNLHADGSPGWGIPMATDIAFSAGVLGLMSRRIPQPLAVFLIALAIVDDLGAVLVIALFYTRTLHLDALACGAGALAAAAAMGRAGVRNVFLYALLFIASWVAFLQSGVHAAVAGVLFAFTIPVTSTFDPGSFMQWSSGWMERFQRVTTGKQTPLLTAAQQQALRAMERQCVQAEAPLQRLESRLAPLCAFVIMPLFAFANSGVQLEHFSVRSLIAEPVTLGVIAGLVLGKQLGIMLTCYLAVTFGIAALPRAVNWKLMYGLSCLAGIGFTMSLFIGELAFGRDAGPGAVPSPHLAGAKLGTLLASLIAGALGTAYLLIITAARSNTATLPRE